jgi:hypothetical protein
MTFCGFDFNLRLNPRYGGNKNEDQKKVGKRHDGRGRFRGAGGVHQTITD